MDSDIAQHGAMQPADVADGRYAVGEEIGHGGKARVYRGRDRLLRRDVAVKVFRARAEDPEELHVQESEAKVLAALNHYALTTLFDAGADLTDALHPQIYLVMEHVLGGDLRRRLRRGPLEPLQVAYLGFDLSNALAYLHAAGFLHRDIKPANVLLVSGDDDPRLRGKLADFGISSLIGSTGSGDAVTGTAAYLSPEQASGEEALPASDVYALGLVLLEALSGRVAFPGDVETSALARLDRDPVIPDAVPKPLAAVLRGMLARDPAQRTTPAAAAAALQDVVVDDLVRQRIADRPAADPEAQRLEAVRRYNVLDTPPEEAFDEVTALVARVLHVPVALIAMIGEDEVQFKSRVGVPSAALSRSVTAAFVAEGPAGTWNLPDVLAVPSLREHPFVAGEPHVRSALAAPLTTHDGQTIGRIMACDVRRRLFTDDEAATLEAFGRIVMRELELRLASRRALFER